MLFFIFLKILIFVVVRRFKEQKWPKMTKKLCCAFHLRSHTSYDLHLWCTFRCALQGVKGQKIIQSDKKTMSVALHISGTIHNMIVICGTQVENDDISRHCFHFVKSLIFQVDSRVKGQNIAQNDKKICLLHSIFQEP